MCQKDPKDVRRSISLSMSNVDRRSIVPKFNVPTKLKIGDNTLSLD